jgi:hypothetical protein
VYFLYVSTYAAGKSTNLSWMVSGAPWRSQSIRHMDIKKKEDRINQDTGKILKVISQHPQPQNKWLTCSYGQKLIHVMIVFLNYRTQQILWFYLFTSYSFFPVNCDRNKDTAKTCWMAAILT